MPTLPSLTEAQLGAVRDYMQSLTPNTTQYLSAEAVNANEDLIKPLLTAADRTQERYPNLYKSLDNYTPYSGTVIDQVHLVDAGETETGAATATVWSTSERETLVQGGSLLAFDHDSGALVGYGSNAALKSGFLAVPTFNDSAKKAGKELDLLYLGHATGTDEVTRLYSFATTVPTTTSGIQMNIEAPVLSAARQNQKEILIAVGRKPGWANEDADYVYMNSSNDRQAYLIIPFVGNVALPGNVDMDKLSADSFRTTIVLDNANGTSASQARATQYTTDEDMVKAFSETTGNLLKWNFPYDGYQHGDKEFTNTQSIVYQPGALTSQKVCYFFFAFENIPLTNGTYAGPYYVCSEDTPETSSLNCTRVNNLMFWWHCIAAGTQITLEDGTTLPVEDVNETYRVRTGTDGNSFAISATVLGKHSSDPTDDDESEELIFELKTENGKSLTATQSHMIFLPNGQVRKIIRLEPGDEIMTDDGPSKVVSNQAIKHSGMFYGLVLGNKTEQNQPDFPHGLASYYANGILTGDHHVLKHHAGDEDLDLDQALKSVPESMHQDYASAVADKVY